MAGTPLGAAITDAYRAQQLAIQAGSLDGLLLLWRAVDATRLGDTIDVFAQAAAILAGQGFAQSAAGAVAYYPLFRRAEVGTAVTIGAASAPAQAALAAEIRGSALTGIINGRRAGMSVEAAQNNGLVKVIGTMSKLVLAGGRRTIIQGIDGDREAEGWMRATSGDPCPFCRMLASRGAAYKTAKSADFQPHDHCSCTPEPLYRSSKKALGVSEASKEYARQWKAAQEWARETDARSDGTSNNALNNFRRYLAAGQPTAGRAGQTTEDSGQ